MKHRMKELVLLNIRGHRAELASLVDGLSMAARRQAHLLERDDTEALDLDRLGRILRDARARQERIRALEQVYLDVEAVADMKAAS